MSEDIQITITGNSVEDTELRYTPTGVAIAKFRVASTPRHFDKTANEWKDGEALFLPVTVWRQQAENVCESVYRGTRVVVTGRLKQRSYETKEGEKRTVYEVDADDVAVSLKFATAKVAKASRSTAAQASGGQAQTDPWASADPGGFSDAPPV